MLIAHVASPLADLSRLIEAQAAGATMIADSPTMVDLVVTENARPIPLPDGPIPVRATVYDDEGRLTGEILVWVRGGRLIGIEQAWVTDDPPTDWPSPATVRLR